MMRIRFLAVHLNNKDEVLTFVRHVMELRRPDHLQVSIAIADNSGNWPDTVPVPDGVSIVRCPRNLGYLNGCQHALAACVQQTPPDWVFVANTDISLRHDFLELLAGFPPSSNLGVLAPRITRSDGCEQNPHYRARPSRKRMLAYRWIYQSRMGLQLLEWLSRLRHRDSVSGVREPVQQAPEQVYAAHGSLFGLSRRFFERGGLLQYGSFLYAEELHIAEQARLHGLNVEYHPELTVFHAAKAVTRSQGSRQRQLWKAQSLAWILKTYYSCSPESAPIVSSSGVCSL